MSVKVREESSQELQLYARLRKCSSELNECEGSQSLLERGAMGVVERAEASGWVGQGDMVRIEEVMNSDV